MSHVEPKLTCAHPSLGVVIVDVDCTSSKGKPVCSTHNVRGYPTMKYFNAETGEELVVSDPPHTNIFMLTTCSPTFVNSQCYARDIE
eukprot:77497-Amphidinium_carterae.1